MKSEKSQYHRVSCIGGIKTKHTHRKGNRASVTRVGRGHRGQVAQVKGIQRYRPPVLK